VSADSIVPSAGNPQALNRYAYVFNNPLKYVDPTGHCPKHDDECEELQQQAQEAFSIKLTGDWSKDNLVTLFDALEAVSRAVGGINAFQAIWKGIELQRFHDFPGSSPWGDGGFQSPFAGLTLPGGNIIQIFDQFDKITIAHELGHVMDYRTCDHPCLSGKYTAYLIAYTGSYFTGLFNNTFVDPTVENPQRFKGFINWGFANAPEDWASAFAGYVYPEAFFSRIGRAADYSLFVDQRYSTGNDFVRFVLQQYASLDNHAWKGYGPK
jgi:hypothetical protein